jgi:hypothetical protein
MRYPWAHTKAAPLRFFRVGRPDVRSHLQFLVSDPDERELVPTRPSVSRRSTGALVLTKSSHRLNAGDGTASVGSKIPRVRY